MPMPSKPPASSRDSASPKIAICARSSGEPCVGVLIYFIHHVSMSMQADQVVARVGQELTDEIDRLFPERIGDQQSGSAIDSTDTNLPEAFDREARPVLAVDDGYLQHIEMDTLLTLATQANILLRLERRPGQYVVSGRPLVMVWPGECVTDEFTAQVNDAFALENQRASAQDVEYSIHQLVEIAVRALSTGINDPFTAVACVDRLGSALSRLAQRKMPSPYRRDEQQRLRVLATPITFPEIVDAALNQIRQCARPSAAVTIRLLETIALVAEAVHRPADRAALRRHAEMIARGAREGLPEEEDRRVVEDRFELAIGALNESQALRR